MPEIVFENFARAVKGFVTLDFIKIAKVDCIVQTNYYTKVSGMSIPSLFHAIILIPAFPRSSLS